MSTKEAGVQGTRAHIFPSVFGIETLGGSSEGSESVFERGADVGGITDEGNTLIACSPTSVHRNTYTAATSVSPAELLDVLLKSLHRKAPPCGTCRTPGS